MHHRLSCLCTGIYSVGWSLGVLLQTLVLLLVLLLHYDHHYFNYVYLYILETPCCFLHHPFCTQKLCEGDNMLHSHEHRPAAFWICGCGSEINASEKNRCRLRQRNPFILYNVMYLHIFLLKKQGIVVKSSNHLTFLQPWLVPSFPFGTTSEGYYLQHFGAGLQGRRLNFGCRKRRFHGDKHTDNLMSCLWHRDTPKNSLMV